MVIDQAKKNYEVLYNTNHHAHVLLFVLAARDALSLNLSKEDVDKLSEKVGCHLRGHKRVKSFEVNYLLGISLCRNATCLCDRSPLDPITPGIHSTPSVEISLTPRFLRGRFRSATAKSLASRAHNGGFFYKEALEQQLGGSRQMLGSVPGKKNICPSQFPCAKIERRNVALFKISQKGGW